MSFRSKLLSSTVVPIAIGVGVVAMSINPPAQAASSIQVAAYHNPCNPCAAANPCNPCNPCAAKLLVNPCNPCAAANPCNPCAAANPCNPCAAANPCNPCAATQ